MYYYVIYASSIGLSRLSHEYYDKERLVSKKRRSRQDDPKKQSTTSKKNVCEIISN